MPKLFEKSEQAFRLDALFLQQDPGTYLSYKEIETQADVPMDLQGKALMRTSLKRCKLEYTCHRGDGIEIGCAKNMMQIVSRKALGIHTATRRTVRAQTNLERFEAELDAVAQTRARLFRQSLALVLAQTQYMRQQYLLDDKRVKKLIATPHNIPSPVRR